MHRDECSVVLDEGGDGAADIKDLDPGDFPGSQRVEPSTQAANGPTRVACSVKEHEWGYVCIATGEKEAFRREEWRWQKSRVGLGRAIIK